MDIIYILQIKVAQNAYQKYKRCLQSRIEGDASIGIKGMMEVTHNGMRIFPSVELFTTDPIDHFHLLTVRCYTDTVDKVNYYLNHHSAKLRSIVPAEALSQIPINRYIDTGDAIIPLEDIDAELESLYQKHATDMYNFASFEVFG